MTPYKANEQNLTAPLVITDARCILMDIEGTTTAVSFIYDVLFPFARRELHQYVAENWHTKEVQKAAEYLSLDLGYANAVEWLKAAKSQISDPDAVGDPDRATDKLLEKAQQNLVVAELERLMDGDVKSTGLKEIQGLIWAVGYERGELNSQVFDDVVQAFEEWKSLGVDLRIFSSGSINAQRVFFQHTRHGDLSHYLSGYYDTTTGPKREVQSYRLIAKDAGFAPAEVLFLSDVVSELEAAHQAGMKVALVVRPGNATSGSNVFPSIESFDQISIVSPKIH